jgi:hypothetical protein
MNPARAITIFLLLYVVSIFGLSLLTWLNHDSAMVRAIAAAEMAAVELASAYVSL